MKIIGVTGGIASGKSTVTAYLRKQNIPVFDADASAHEEIMLIVDDVKLNRVILANIFKQNYTIVEADNGAAALHYLFENADKIAIVMLDLIMPIMDGFEVLSKMKLSPELNLIPIIVTSQTGEEMEIKALKMGADDFVAKPYVKELCHKRVENVLAAVRKN